MTWADTSLSRSLTRTRLFLKKQLWVWPILAFILLSVIGFSVRWSIESIMRENLASEMQTILTMKVSMIDTWLRTQMTNADGMAREASVRKIAYGLIDALGTEAPTPAADLNRWRRQLAAELDPFLLNQDYVGFILVDRKQHVIASTHDLLVEQVEVPSYSRFFARALNGESIVTPPMPSATLMRDDRGELRTGVPTMFVCVPLRDEGFNVLGALALQLRPEKAFTRIMQLGRLGQSGETYAFNHEGTMVSNSRFDESLILLGLLPDKEDSQSLLGLSLRDPGGDMTKGYRPTIRRAELPLTKMAAEAIAGRDGVDVEGFRDYRGVKVVGAWHWLETFEFGIASEIDHDEAFRPLSILRWAFSLLYGLLIVSAIAIFVFTVIVARLRRDAQVAAVEAKQLGQYQLEKKIGEGAMGVVYRGYHAMMRRPTAIKLLHLDRVTDASVKRFEQEVQITCQLNHPNTIAIYDYGRTPEDVFYYAMEYLDGIDLQTLITRYGPQPQGRVVEVMLQVCGSLYEAHSRGLVHRDIKPANIMLNRRGGVPDVVKVLDFGLVIDREAERSFDEGLTGTPLYLSPEAIETPSLVDPCSDLYAVGAVGYFMLVGRPVFEANRLVELLQKHVSETVVPPSDLLAVPVLPELESAILACLEKSRARRPQTARDLANLLRRCDAKASWSIEEAELWWSNHERGVRTRHIASEPPNSISNSALSASSTSSPKSSPSTTGLSPINPSVSKSSTPSPLPLPTTPTQPTPNADADLAVFQETTDLLEASPSTSRNGFDQTIDLPSPLLRPIDPHQDSGDKA